MEDNIVALKARKLFVKSSKVVPFVLCALICASYTEIVISLAYEDFVCYGKYIVPNVPFSWIIGEYFEYSYPLVIGLLVIVYATSTCKWNKMGCYYIGIALLEKSYFDFEMEVWLISVICTLNIIVSGFLVYKGVVILLRNR